MAWTCVATGPAVGSERARPVMRGHVARDAEHREAIAAVGRELEREVGVVELQVPRARRGRPARPRRAPAGPRDPADSPSSRAEHSMPLDSTPRSFAALISRPRRASRRPARTGTFWPSATFGAPQTIVSSLARAGVDLRSRAACRRSGAAPRTSRGPRRCPRTAAATGVISSTSRPPIVSASRELARPGMSPGRRAHATS